MRKALGVALAERFRDKYHHHLFCGDIGFGVFDDLREQSPQQFHNFGISEQHMVSYAAAFASSINATCMVYTINPFITARVADQLRVDVAYANAPLIICSVGAGFAYDSLGFTHYGIEDLALISALPNFRIFTPCEGLDVTDIMQQLFAARTVEAPCYLRLQKGGDRQLSKDFPGAVHKGSYKRWPGDDIEIITHGAIAEEALKAREALKGEVSVAVRPVIDWHDYLRGDAVPPLPEMIFLEENRASGSLANAIINAGLAPIHATAPLRLTCVRNAEFHAMTLRPSALKANAMDADSLVRDIKDIVQKKSKARAVKSRK
jgi:transketolase